MLNPFLLQIQSDWNGQLKCVEINADENLKLANDYRLSSLPTIIVFERGSIIHRVDGFQGREELHRGLNQIMNNVLAQSA